MYRLAKFGGHKSYRNEDIDCYISSYIDTLKKAKLTISIRHIARFFKSGILIHNSEIRDTAGRKTKREGGEEEHRQLQSIMRFTQTQKNVA